MNPNKIFSDILDDFKVELTDEFDLNFQRKSWFNEAWPKNKLLNQKGSMMMRSGNLRNSIQSKKTNDAIVFTSSLPYARIQNEGGELTVTAKMKRFFWYKFYEATGQTKKDKSGKAKGKVKLSIEATQWRNMALMKVGDKITIPKRQFIGNHPRVREIAESICNEHMQKLHEDIKQRFNPNK